MANPAAKMCLNGRGLEILFGLFLIYLVTGIELNKQALVRSRSCTDGGQRAPACTEGDNPLLDFPIWWYDDNGERTPERECTPKRLQRCVDAAAAPTAVVGADASAADDWCCTQLADPDAPHFEAQVSSGALLMYGVVYPLLLCIAANVAKWKLPQFPTPLIQRDLLIGLLYSHVFSLVAMGYFKYNVGRPRPNYYAIHIWAENAASLTDESARETWRVQSLESFPSGHSSITASGCVYVTVVALDLVWHWFTTASHPLTAIPVLRTAAISVCLVPTMFGMWVAATRTEDYWHFYDDVIAGNLLGTAAAIFSYNFVAPTPVPALSDADREAGVELLPVGGGGMESGLSGLGGEAK